MGRARPRLVVRDGRKLPLGCCRTERLWVEILELDADEGLFSRQARRSPRRCPSHTYGRLFAWPTRPRMSPSHRKVGVVTSTLNRAFLGLGRRADQVDPRKLVETFVDVGPLFAMLSSEDHQIIYGRRGTGKTHALWFLDDEVRKRGDHAVFIDMRTIGSTGGVIADPNIPMRERGTRLLLDTLAVIHDSLATRALEMHEEEGDFTQAMSILDQLGKEISESVRVVGTTSVEESRAESATREGGLEASLSLHDLKVGATSKSASDQSSSRAVRREGVESHSVRFGSVASLIGKVVPALGIGRLWLLVDEWSSTPMDLQPILADLLRRSFFPVQGVTVKIAAIEQRSEFRVSRSAGDYLGLEVGADAAADVHLDDFMVFGNNADRAKEFFGTLIFRHVVADLIEDGEKESEIPSSPQQVEKDGFTQRNAFDEFVKAAEGVPRDAINILKIAAQRAVDDPVSVAHIRSAARDWYQRDKESALSDDARDLLVWIISEVIGDRQARAFMLEQGEDRRHPLILSLYDARVLHLIRRGIASQDSDRAGTRFNGWGLDYGCYVHLINTVKSPKGLFEVQAAGTGTVDFVEVPSDDYRSIRRAILDLHDFENRAARLPFD